jgi:hypothetical protein
MNTKRTSNLLRSIAFFLTGVILVCTFGFTVDGWMVKEQDVPTQNFPTVDEITDDVIPEIPVEEEKVIYYNPITGLETTEELFNLAPLAYVMEKNSPLFGLSGADIIIDIPTEEGNRLLTIRTDNKNLWKIGSMAPERGYISNLAGFFGASIISLGNDDIIDYESCIPPSMVNVTGLSYKEYNSYTYTNSDLLKGSIIEQQFSATLPYIHAETEENILFESQGAKAKFDNTELVYDEETSTYIWFENGEAQRDHINGKTLSFTNCLILFSDSVIYDNQAGTQMVMNTIGTGSGYYLTGGTFTKVNYTSSQSGSMTFYSENGEQLVINRGEIYIRYLKSSMKNNITIS